MYVNMYICVCRYLCLQIYLYLHIHIVMVGRLGGVEGMDGVMAIVLVQAGPCEFRRARMCRAYGSRGGAVGFHRHLW